MKRTSFTIGRRAGSTLALLAPLLALLLAGPANAGRGRCRRDADCDGLSNKQERALGTSRSSADTDRDGLSDGAEVNKFGTDPTDPDSDDDGLSDGDEVADHSDPSNGDSDGDGTADGDDDDPTGEGEPRLAGPLDSADDAAKTVTLFGLVVDASGAVLDGVTFADLTTGTFVEVKLDGSKLPALVATRIEADHDDGDDEGHDGGHGDGHDD